MILNMSKSKECCGEDFLSDYTIFFQSLLLIVSNFFGLPAIYLSIKYGYLGEAFIYFLTMLCSAFYHLCDNEGMKYCLLDYQVLQFTDFYSAILSVWVTAILMANLTYEWRSVLHLSGSLIFAGLLRNQTTGVWSFVVPGVCSGALVCLRWFYHYYSKRLMPSSASLSNLIPGTVLIVTGAALFASQVTKFGQFYGFTHSGWHICMSLAMAFLMPRPLITKNNLSEYSDKVCVLSFTSIE